MGLEADVRAALRWLEDAPVPPDVEQSARRLVLDTLGCAIAGFAKPELRAMSLALAGVDPGHLRLPGMREGLNTSACAYLVAMAACWDEACEGLARAHGRPGLHTIPGVVALSLQHDATLGRLIRATIAGYEIAGRLGEALRILPGMHVDGIWGGFGATVGAAHLLGCTESQTYAAIEGIACQLPWSQYLPVSEGATVRNAYVAEAAGRGLRQALAAQAGVTSPSGAMSRFNELALGASADRALAPAGEWLIGQGYLKPYAAVRHVHYGVEAALEWRRRFGPPQSIDSVVLTVYPEAMRYCGNRAPSTAIQAQFSLSYGLAYAIVYGDLTPEAYTDEALRDERVRAIEQCVQIHTEEISHGVRFAEVRIASNERSEGVRVDAVLGDPGVPFTTDAVIDKFVRYTEGVIGSGAAARVAERIMTASADTSVSACLEAAS
ncbi:MAG: MmgE/PrpD family protein [Gammaproteobacteria bacterium]|nr:MmgE/PrpD family protein [Gammaproteobacteria bacterium]